MNEKTSGGNLNLAPSVSPDGKRMVFLSERSRLSIDMFLADVETGKVIRQLTKTAGDPHFDSLEFLASAGDWAPDNKRFVFSALSKGQPVLTIIDVDNGKRLLEHEFPDIGEIFNPAWSPTGDQIVFSGAEGRRARPVPLRSSTRRRADAADQRPVRRQRSGMVARRAAAGLGHRSLLVRPADAVVRQLPHRPDGRRHATDSAAGRASARDATRTRSSPPTASACSSSPRPTAFPTSIAPTWPAARTTRITNVLSGVSGITPLTPALSVAAAGVDRRLHGVRGRQVQHLRDHG